MVGKRMLGMCTITFLAIMLGHTILCEGIDADTSTILWKGLRES